MKNLSFLLVWLGVFLSIQNLYAQDSLNTYAVKPIAVENFIGHERQFYQGMVNKIFVEKKKIGLLSISSYSADNKNKQSNNEYLNTTLIYHHIFKGISINSGGTFTSFEGLKPFIGLQYMYQSKSVSLIYMPGYYFRHTPKIANLAFIEYKPLINSKWSVYSRLQLHYNFDLANGNHFRSYVYSRLGLSYKSFSFGLAHNFDAYGAEKNTKNNYGIFWKINI